MLIKKLVIKSKQLLKLPEFELDILKYKGSGGMGRWIEEFLGIKENNLKKADYGITEIKSHDLASHSRVTFFTESPTASKDINIKMLRDFGYLKGSTTRLSVAIDHIKVNNQSLKLELRNSDIHLISSKKRDLGVIWKGKHIRNRVEEKINNLMLVCYSSRKEDDKKFIKIKNIYFYEGFINFNKHIKEGKIVIEPRIVIRDHGWAFRVPINHLDNCYKEVHEIK